LKTDRTHTKLSDVINELRFVITITVFIGRLVAASFSRCKSRHLRLGNVSSIVATIRSLKDPSWVTRMRMRSRSWLLKVFDRGPSIGNRRCRLVTGGLGPFVRKGITIFENPFSWVTFAWTVDDTRILESR